MSPALSDFRKDFDGEELLHHRRILQAVVPVVAAQGHYLLWQSLLPLLLVVDLLHLHRTCSE